MGVCFDKPLASGADVFVGFHIETDEPKVEDMQLYNKLE